MCILKLFQHCLIVTKLKEYLRNKILKRIYHCRTFHFSFINAIKFQAYKNLCKLVQLTELKAIDFSNQLSMPNSFLYNALLYDCISSSLLHPCCCFTSRLSLPTAFHAILFSKKTCCVK